MTAPKDEVWGPDDVTLIARVLDRDDRRAFAFLVRRHQSSVRTLLRRLCCGDSAQADDLAQEAFTRAYKGLAKYRCGAKFSSWLFRIAYNVFLTHHKRTQRARELESALTSEGSRAAEPQGDLHADIERALAQLSQPERAAVVLSCGHGSSHADVAHILDCPLGTAKTCIARAKTKLREQLAIYADSGAQ